MFGVYIQGKIPQKYFFDRIVLVLQKMFSKYQIKLILL